MKLARFGSSGFGIVLPCVYMQAREQHPKVSLHTDNLFQKLVHSHRGGYCFEQNFLFAAALRACGFAIYMLSARYLLSSCYACIPGAFLPALALHQNAVQQQILLI